MRVATYTEYSFSSRASLIAILMLVLTIAQGTSATLTLILSFVPALQPSITLIWFAMYFVAMLGLMLTQGINWIFWLMRYRFLLVILMIGTVFSIFWSLDQNISFERTVHLLGTTLVAIYIGFMIPLNTILKVLAWTWALIMLLSVGFVLILPEVGIESYEGASVWRGILTSKNTLGFWAAIGAMLYISFLNRPVGLASKFGLVLLALASLAILYLSHSATSLVSLIVAGSIAIYFFISIRFQLGFVRMVVLAVLFTTFIALILLNIDTSDLVGRSGDMTGRGEVWAQTWKLILEKPATGYGYGTIWNPSDTTIWIQQSLTDFTWVVYHAHNGFLQVASEIGLPLAGIALLMIAQQLIEIFYCQYQRQQPGVLFVLGFALAYLISNYSEARFLVHRELYWILFIALPISMLRQIDIATPLAVPESGADDDAVDARFTRYETAAGVAGASTRPASRTPEQQPTESFDDVGEFDPYELTGEFSEDDKHARASLDELDFNDPDSKPGKVDILLDKKNRKKPDSK